MCEAVRERGVVAPWHREHGTAAVALDRVMIETDAPYMGAFGD